MKTNIATSLILLSLFTQTTYAMESNKDGFFSSFMTSLHDQTSEPDTSTPSVGTLLTKAQENTKDLVTQHPYATGAVILLPLAIVGWWTYRQNALDIHGRLHFVLYDKNKVLSNLNQARLRLAKKIDLKSDDSILNVLPFSGEAWKPLLYALCDARNKLGTVRIPPTVNDSKQYWATITAMEDSNKNSNIYLKIKEFQEKHVLKMQQPKAASQPCLHLSLGEKRDIGSWSQEGTSFLNLKDVKEYKRVDYDNVLGLTDSYHKNVLHEAFNDADKTKKVTKVTLARNDQTIVAKIVPLRVADSVDHKDYYVKIAPLTK